MLSGNLYLDSVGFKQEQPGRISITPHTTVGITVEKGKLVWRQHTVCCMLLFTEAY